MMGLHQVSLSQEATVSYPFGSAERSRPKKRRALTIYWSVALIALLPSLFDWTPFLQALGLGLVFPGAGFLVGQGASVLLFPLSILLMALATLLFQFAGFASLPPLVWGLTAIGAMLMAPEQASPNAPIITVAAAFIVALTMTIISYKKVAAEKKRRVLRDGYVPRVMAEISAKAAPVPTAGSRELSPDDLAHLRYVLDRGLQPVESLNGFDEVNEIQASAIRYQLNYLLWALQVAQCHYTPNFHGYANQAQRNMLDKMTVPKVWKWWRWESLLGNFSINFDPVARDNIMFGAFSNANLAMYTANTGDDHYLQHGSLTFVDNKWQKYEHSLHTFLEIGSKNHQNAEYGPLYPCEPKLTFSACNLLGNIGHLAADRALGTNFCETLIQPLKHAQLTEMMAVDGTPLAGRVEHLGIRMLALPGNFVSGQFAWMSSPFFPEITSHLWAIMREETIHFDDNGDISIDIKFVDKIDIGNFQLGTAGLYAHYLLVAQEIGDTEVVEAIICKLERDFGKTERDGVIAYRNASNLINAVIIFGRLTRRNDIHNMVLNGPSAESMTGPLLDDVGYPDVLVAKAYSRGEDLALVLYPGLEQESTASAESLGLSRLTANAFYDVNVAGGDSFSFVADAEGCARIDIILAGRTEVMIEPQRNH